MLKVNKYSVGNMVCSFIKKKNIKSSIYFFGLLKMGIVFSQNTWFLEASIVRINAEFQLVSAQVSCILDAIGNL